MDKIIVIIWLATAAVIFGACIFWTGLEKAKKKVRNPYGHDDALEAIPGFVGFALFWPLLILLAPFFGLYYLGKYLGAKIVINNDF